MENPVRKRADHLASSAPLRAIAKRNAPNSAVPLLAPNPGNPTARVERCSKPPQGRPRACSFASCPAEDIIHRVGVTLEDLYNGKTLLLAITRHEFVSTNCRLCNTCRGNGFLLKYRKVEARESLIGSYDDTKKYNLQRVHITCPVCKGEGSEHVQRVVRQTVTLPVPQGMQHHDKIVSSLPSTEPQREGAEAQGKLVCILEQQPHDRFQRRGNDLVMHKTLTLRESLTGYDFSVRHLDGRELRVRSKPGEIMAPSLDGKPVCRVIRGEGMPRSDDPLKRGDLYLVFRVEFPPSGSLSTGAIAALRNHLPGPSGCVKAQTSSSDKCGSKEDPGDPIPDVEAASGDDEEGIGSRCHIAPIQQLSPAEITTFGTGGDLQTRQD